MKRFLAYGLVFLMLVALPVQVLAETVAVTGAETQKIKVGSSVLVKDVCTFTIRSAKPYDVFMNTQSGDAADFLVVTLDIINWKTEPLYLRTQMKASLEYDESFDFEPAYLWGNPGGTYRNTSPKNNYVYDLNVYKMDDAGIISSSAIDRRDGYERPFLNARRVNAYSEAFYSFNPEEDCFGLEQNDTYSCIDGSKTVLDPLVQRTMHYVFKVPNIVVKDEGLRVLTLTIDGNDYQLTF